MKTLKYVSAAILLLLIAFFLLGQLNSKITYQCEVLVEKPVKESWAVANDENKMKDWLSGFEKLEPVSGIPGEVGSVSLIYFNNDGQEMSIRETIQEVNPEKSVAMLFEDDFMNMNYRMTFTDTVGYTKITTQTVAIGNGLFSKSFMALMTSKFEEQELQNLENLKEVIENNKTDYSNIRR